MIFFSRMSQASVGVPLAPREGACELSRSQRKPYYRIDRPHGFVSIKKLGAVMLSVLMGTDRDSIAAVYSQRHAGFAAALATVAGGTEAGRDAVQEGFAIALRERSKFRGGSLEAWVWKIALRAALRARHSDGNQPLDIGATDPQFVDPERDPQLTAAIASLPPQRRLIVFLRYFADLSYAEIAEALEVSKGTVAAALAQARAALAAEITAEEGR